jgi:hypothetical protein
VEETRIEVAETGTEVAEARGKFEKSVGWICLAADILTGSSEC